MEQLWPGKQEGLGANLALPLVDLTLPNFTFHMRKEGSQCQKEILGLISLFLHGTSECSFSPERPANKRVCIGFRLWDNDFQRKEDKNYNISRESSDSYPQPSKVGLSLKLSVPEWGKWIHFSL